MGIMVFEDENWNADLKSKMKIALDEIAEIAKGHKNQNCATKVLQEHLTKIENICQKALGKIYP